MLRNYVKHKRWTASMWCEINFLIHNAAKSKKRKAFENTLSKNIIVIYQNKECLLQKFTRGYKIVLSAKTQQDSVYRIFSFMFNIGFGRYQQLADITIWPYYWLLIFEAEFQNICLTEHCYDGVKINWSLCYWI